MSDDREREQYSCDRGEETVLLDARPAVGEDGGECEELEHDLGIRIPAIPDLCNVEGQQERTRDGGRATQEPDTAKVDGDHPQDGEYRCDLPRTGQSVDAVSDSDPDRIQVRKLSDNRALVGIDDEEGHEAIAVVRRARPLGEKQVSVLGWNGGDQRVMDGQRPSLCDLNAFDQIRTRVAAADDIFRRRDIREDGERHGHEADWKEGGATGWWGCLETQTAPAYRDKEDAQRTVDPEETVELVPAGRRKAHPYHRRGRDAECDRPEDPFFGR